MQVKKKKEEEEMIKNGQVVIPSWMCYLIILFIGIAVAFIGGGFYFPKWSKSNNGENMSEEDIFKGYREQYEQEKKLYIKNEKKSVRNKIPDTRVEIEEKEEVPRHKRYPRSTELTIRRGRIDHVRNVSNEELMSMSYGDTSFETIFYFMDRYRNTLPPKDRPSCIGHPHLAGYIGSSLNLFSIYQENNGTVLRAANVVISGRRSNVKASYFATSTRYPGKSVPVKTYETIHIEFIDLDLDIRNTDIHSIDFKDSRLTDKRLRGPPGWGMEIGIDEMHGIDRFA